MALWPAVLPDPHPSPERLADTTRTMQITVLSAFHFLALTFVGLRVYTRGFVTKSFGRDDIALCIAGLCAIGGWVLFLMQSFHGLGRHIETISLEDGYIFRACGYFLSIVTSNWGMCSLKTAIGFNLLRFCDSKLWRGYRIAIWGLLSIVWCYTFIYMIFALVHCKPVHKFWDLEAEGTCIPISRYVRIAMGNTVLATSTDVFLALVPIPVVWHIRLGVKIRFYLIGILSLGYFSVGLGVVKTVYQQAFTSQKDKTYYLNVPFWGFLQLQVGIIAACCVALRPLVNRLFGLSQSSGPSDSSALSPPPTVGSKPVRIVRSKTSETATGDEFELSDSKALRGDEEVGMQGTSFYSSRLDDSCSEETIITKEVSSRVADNGRNASRSTLPIAEVSVRYNSRP